MTIFYIGQIFFILQVYYTVSTCLIPLRCYVYVLVFGDPLLCLPDLCCRFYLVFDKMYGGTLLDNIERRGTLTEQDASMVIRDIATAISFLHNKGKCMFLESCMH